MKKEAIHAFTARVTQASRSELTVILYEMVLTELAEAQEAYDQGELPGFEKGLKQAQKYVSELMATLDYKYTISYDLMSLYLYVNKRIITALMKRDPEPISGAQSVLQKLLAGFEGVSRQDKSGPMMKNTQKVYAGLTYGRGTLNETSLDPSTRSRGFIA